MVDLNKLLAAALILWQEYRQRRDELIAKGDPTDPNTGAVKTDAELIALFRGDVADFNTLVDGLLAKHGGQ
jgi:hypothetical protein